MCLGCSGVECLVGYAGRRQRAPKLRNARMSARQWARRRRPISHPWHPSPPVQAMLKRTTGVWCSAALPSMGPHSASTSQMLSGPSSAQADHTCLPACLPDRPPDCLPACPNACLPSGNRWATWCQQWTTVPCSASASSLELLTAIAGLRGAYRRLCPHLLSQNDTTLAGKTRQTLIWYRTTMRPPCRPGYVLTAATGKHSIQCERLTNSTNKGPVSVVVATSAGSRRFGEFSLNLPADFPLPFLSQAAGVGCVCRVL